MNHVMFDCETLGTRPGSIITQIGAVFFDPTGKLGAEFEVNVDIVASQDAGLTIDASTVTWWLMQAPQAITSAFFRSALQPDVAAHHLAMFLSQADRPLRVWSHGAGADIVWLEAWHRALGIATPWTYRDARDTRTLFDLTGVRPALIDGETEHDALSDARAQARAVCEAMRILKPQTVAS